MSLAISALTLIVAFSPETVGVATTDGGMRIDGLAVSGTGTVADGARLETEARPARLTLRGGATVDIGSQSRVRVHSDRLFLEAGSSTVRGKMNVFSAEGVLVGRPPAAPPVALHAPPAPSSAAELSGVIESKDGVWLIHDEASRLSFPLEASGPEAEKLSQAVGKKVTVKGELRSGKVRVVAVESAAPATVAAAEAAVAAAKTSGATTGATAAGGAGVSKAVIAGVAIAGVAATGATVGFVQAQSQPSSTVSQ
jgi:hypothetical protein